MNKSIIYKATEDKDIQEDLRKLEVLQKELKDLQKEQCEDAVSRQAVIDTLDRMDKVLDEDRTVEMYRDLLKECYTVLPSVNPQKTKMGHWKERRNRATGHIETVCSECGAEEGYPYNDYCGNCGAQMFDPQESEV